MHMSMLSLCVYYELYGADVAVDAAVAVVAGLGPEWMSTNLFSSLTASNPPNGNHVCASSSSSLRNLSSLPFTKDGFPNLCP